MTRLAVRTVLVALLAALPAVLGGGCASIGTPGDDPAARANAALADKIARAREARAAASSSPPLGEAPGPTLPGLLTQGDALVAAGDPSRALLAYLKAHDLHRSHPAPLLRIAGLHLRKDPERSVAIFEELARREPAAPGPKTGLGLARVAQGDYAAAEIVLRQALDVEPDYPAALNALGLVLEQRSAHEEARRHFARAAELQPRSYVPLNNLGVSYLATHDDLRARDAFRRAALLEHRDPLLFNNLGVALGRTGRFDEALEAFRRGGPEHAAWNNLGFVHYERGEPSAAIKAYEKALLAAPTDDRLEILRNLDLAVAVRDGRRRRPSAALILPPPDQPASVSPPPAEPSPAIPSSEPAALAPSEDAAATD